MKYLCWALCLTMHFFPSVTSYTCRISHFACHNNKCISPDHYCDGIDDCGDGSDEPKFCTGKRVRGIPTFITERMRIFSFSPSSFGCYKARTLKLTFRSKYFTVPKSSVYTKVEHRAEKSWKSVETFSMRVVHRETTCFRVRGICREVRYPASFGVS